MINIQLPCIFYLQYVNFRIFILFIPHSKLNFISFLFWTLILRLDLVDDLLMLTDKYDFAIVRQKCVEFLINLKNDPFFQLRIADKYKLAELEVIIPIYFSSDY